MTGHKCRHNEAETDGKVTQILMKRSEGAEAQQEKKQAGCRNRLKATEECCLEMGEYFVGRWNATQKDCR